MLGARRTTTRQVTDQDLASVIYPTVCKPPVLATARLLEWCELVAMEELGGCVVGSSAHVLHLAPAVVGRRVLIEATCTSHDGNRTDWAIHVWDGLDRIAVVDLTFHSIDMARYITQRVTPKLLPS